MIQPRAFNIEIPKEFPEADIHHCSFLILSEEGSPPKLLIGYPNHPSVGGTKTQDIVFRTALVTGVEMQVNNTIEINNRIYEIKRDQNGDLSEVTPFLP